MTVYEKLAPFGEEKYRDFQSALVPNIPKSSILGVRTPVLRKFAREISGTDEASAFLADTPHKYYEENLIHFFLISYIKDFDECAAAVEGFLPFVDCWPVCDQSSPKAFRKNRAKLILLIEKWISSERVYTVRFGLRMLRVTGAILTR